MLRKLVILVLFFGIFFNTQLSAQEKSNRDSGLIQFSGLLLTADSLKPIPFGYVYVQHKTYGRLYTDLDGYFALVAKVGDTIVFSHAEFTKSTIVVPDTLKSFKYSVVKLMTRDTQYFAGYKVVAMPPRAIFDEMFARMDIPNDDIQRAKDNLEREAIKEQAGSLAGTDATEAYKTLAKQYANKVNYNAGQYPPMNLLNPFAWAQFFEAWKRGDYKRK